jgi:hypothetical protein
MPPRTAISARAMQRLAEGAGARGVVAKVLELAPVPRGDAMIDRVVELISAMASEGDVRRALRKSGRSGSRIGDVAAVAEALDSSIEPRTDAGELAVRAILEVLLDAADLSALLPSFVARLTERWVLAQLGHAPSDHFASVAEHAHFRAEVGAVVREAARDVDATDFETAIAEIERTLSGGAP